MPNPKELQAQEVAARIACHAAQRIAALMAKPIFSDVEVSEIIGLPLLTLRLLRARGEAPQSFLLGKHRRTSRANLLAWIDSRAQASETTRRRAANDA